MKLPKRVNFTEFEKRAVIEKVEKIRGVQEVLDCWKRGTFALIKVRYAQLITHHPIKKTHMSYSNKLFYGRYIDSLKKCFICETQKEAFESEGFSIL